MQLIGAIVAAVVVVGFSGALLWALLFKSGGSNMPGAARGAGLMLLAGMLKVVFILLGDHASIFAAPWLNWPLIGLAAIGFLVMIIGFGKGPA